MSDLTDRADYVERLLAGTKVERYFYLGICTASVGVLLVSAVVMIVQRHGDATTVVPLFGSTGVITYSSGQIMRVWGDALKFASSGSVK